MWLYSPGWWLCLKGCGTAGCPLAELSFLLCLQLLPSDPPPPQLWTCLQLGNIICGVAAGKMNSLWKCSVFLGTASQPHLTPTI